MRALFMNSLRFLHEPIIFLEIFLEKNLVERWGVVNFAPAFEAEASRTAGIWAWFRL